MKIADGRNKEENSMITGETFTKIALAFANTETTPHLERIGFRVTGRRMFATYLAADNTANIFLTPKEQAVFCGMDAVNVYPLPNKWGLNGATTFVLDNVAQEVLQEALFSAYSAVLASVKKKR